MPEATKELRLSPKKQSAQKCLTMTQAKLPQIRKMNSPNSKKMSQTAVIRSPNSKKIVSPTSSHPLVSNSVSPDTRMAISPDSNVIQTAKKLKKILETPIPASTQGTFLPIDDPNVVKFVDTKKNVPIQTSKVKKITPITKPLKKQKRFHDIEIVNDPPQGTSNSNDDDDSKDKRKKDSESSIKGETKIKCNDNDTSDDPTVITWSRSETWSRDEDRFLLEQIKNGLHANMHGVTEIAHRFPEKTLADVQARIDFLIDFLTQLRN